MISSSAVSRLTLPLIDEWDSREVGCGDSGPDPGGVPLLIKLLTGEADGEGRRRGLRRSEELEANS
jgi:hypothetical protein